MKYILKLENQHLQNRLFKVLASETIEVSTDTDEEGIFITDSILLNKKCILMGSRNDTEQKIINQFQSVQEFIKHLKLFEWDYNHATRKVIAFINTFGGSGATTLSLNGCYELAKSNPAFHLSLDRFPKCNYYLPQNRSLSISDFIFNLKRQKSLLLNTHMSGFQYFNGPYSYMDILEIDSELMKHMINELLDMNFNQVVVDLSNRYDLIQAYEWDILFCVCPTEQNYYLLTHDFVLNQKIHLLLNTIKPHVYGHEISLSEGKYSIIPYDAHLQKGFNIWESDLIMNKLKIILDTKLNYNS
ncbi:MAG: hypothetical protein JXR88_11470 [Clostridia bacterium]|nr:hypothetical protein [Clostridia bacterium]